jgi:hypothetical protein
MRGPLSARQPGQIAVQERMKHAPWEDADTAGEPRLMQGFPRIRFFSS